MSNTHENLSSLFTDIADKLRDKNNTNDEYVADNFPSEIDKLEKINNSQVVKSIAKDKIQIGDTVYTVNASPYDLESGRPYYPLSDTVCSASFSPDGNLLVLGGYFYRRAKVYSVSGTTITYVSDIYANNNNTALDGPVRSIAFSPDGTSLVLGGYFTGCAKIYSVNGTTVTYANDLYADSGSTTLDGEDGGDVYSIAFSPDGTSLVLGGYFTGCGAKVYSVSGTAVVYASDIYDSNNSVLDAGVSSVVFSPDGSTLVLGTDLCPKIYSVNGTTITYVDNVYADNNGTVLNELALAAFSPDGNTLVLGGGEFPGFAKIYSVSGTTITYINDIHANDTELDGVMSLAFSPDGSILVLGESEQPKIFSVNGITFTYIGDVYADNNEIPLSDYANSIAFSPDGSTLVLGGNFGDYAKVYSVNNTVITYIDYIHMNNKYNNSLDGAVHAAAFSPDGNTLVLGGTFSYGAKVYSVNGTTVTYVSDIYAGNSNAALGNVRTAAFSPDGNTLVLGGGDTSGFAKAYSVSGTSITYVSDLYADSNETNFNSGVRSVAFSPDGSTLVLGGYFTGHAKIYSVNGTTITYVSDINDDTLDLAVFVVAFSPNGNLLILGGIFSGNAKVYSVNGTTITYVSNIYANSKGTSLGHYANSIAFSPDGSTLVLGGNFTGCAKIYSVNGTTVTYASDLTGPDREVYTVAFSPDGSTLVLGGYFTGHAKIYSVNGTTITYVSDIYADNSNTALDIIQTAAFSPDGRVLALGSDFAKVYTFSPNSIQYSDKGVYLAPNGLFADLPYGANLGFAKSDAEIDNEVTVKTIGTYAPNNSYYLKAGSDIAELTLISG